MWKRSYSLVLAITVTASLMAVPVAAAISLDKRVDAIQDAYQRLADLQASFTSQTHVKTLGRSVANQGTLYLQKPGKLRIEYQAAPPRHYISNGKTLWIKTPGDKQVMKQKLGKSMPREALAFLNGFGRLRELFTIAPGAGKKPLTKKQTALRLTPKNPSGYQRLDCTFDKRGLLVDLVVVNNSGGTATYHFTDIATNVDLKKGLFQAPK